MGTLRVLNEKGDTAVTWNIEDESTVANARRVFDRLRAQGRMAFGRVAGAPACEATLVREFPVNAEEVIVIRPLAGG